MICSICFYRVSNIVTMLLTFAVLVINIFLAVVYLMELTVHFWALYAAIAIVMAFYVGFVTYLVSTSTLLEVVFSWFMQV